MTHENNPHLSRDKFDIVLSHQLDFSAMKNHYLTPEKIEIKLRHYSSLIVINPKNDKAFFKRGMLYLMLNQIGLALTEFIQSYYLNPNFFEAAFNVGYCYQQLNCFEIANDYFNKSLEKTTEKKEIARVLMCQAELYFNNNFLHLSIENYFSVLEILPDYKAAYFSLAFCFFKKCDYDNALHYFNQIDDNDELSYFYRGECFYYLHHYTLAVFSYQKASEKSDNIFIFERLIQCHYKLKNFSDALREISSGFLIDALDPWLYYYRGLIYLRMDVKRIEIEHDFNIAIRINTYLCNIKNNHYYYDDCHLKKQLAQCYFNLAYYYYKKNDMSAAILNINKAIDCDRDFPFSYYYRALIYSENNNFSAMMVDFETAFALKINLKDQSYYENCINKFTVSCILTEIKKMVDSEMQLRLVLKIKNENSVLGKKFKSDPLASESMKEVQTLYQTLTQGRVAISQAARYIAQGCRDSYSYFGGQSSLFKAVPPEIGRIIAAKTGGSSLKEEQALEIAKKYWGKPRKNS